MSRTSACYTAVDVFCFKNTVLIIFMDHRLLRCCKNSSHLDSSGSQHKCCRHTSAICNTTRCDHRDIHCIDNLRNQYHCGKLSDMSSGLCTLGNDCICTAALHTFCKCYRSNDRNDLHSGCFPVCHVFFRTSCTCCHYFDVLFQDYLCNLVCFRIHQHDVHTKWFVSQLFCLADLFSYPLCRCTACGDQPKATRIGYGCCQMIVCNPGHTALDHRILNS